jgi:hypothetical protein
MFLRATSARAAVVGDGTGVNLALPSPRVRPDAVRDCNPSAAIRPQSPGRSAGWRGFTEFKESSALKPRLDCDSIRQKL